MGSYDERVPNLLILLPLYNDWAAAAEILGRIRAEQIKAEVLLVDDGSTEARPPHAAWQRDYLLTRIQVLHLRRNLGHQRAIATGLVFAHQTLSYDSVLIMDADGEDRPEDIPKLMAPATDSHIVFAARLRRSESLFFKIGYHSYRVLHRVATGIPVRVGNFSLLPKSAVDVLVVSSDVWNHYAAAVFRTRLPRLEVPCARGRRLQGESKMNFISLVVHGISALSVFADVVSARFLTVTVLAIIACVAAALLTARGSIVFELMLVLIVQLVTLALALCFLITNGRSQNPFLPLRDCQYFIGNVEEL